MQEDRTYNKEKSYRVMRTIYDVTVGVLMMGVAVVVLMAEKWNIQHLLVWSPGCVIFLVVCLCSMALSEFTEE